MTRRKIITIAVAVTMAVAAAVTVAVVLSRDGREEALAEAKALLYEGQRDFDNNKVLASLSKLQQSVTAFRELNDSDGLFEAVVYMTMAYDQIGQKQEAYRVLKTVNFRDVGRYEAYSSQYYLRMMAYYTAIFDRDYETSDSITLQAIDFSRRKYPKDKVFVYMDMANRAELHIMRGDTAEAMRMIEQLEAAEPVEYRIYLSELYYCRGLIYDKAGQTDSAYAAYERALVYARRYHTMDNELNVLRELAQADSAAGRMAPYMTHRRAYDSLKTEQNGSEIYYKVALMKEQHKMEMMKQENEKDRTIHLLSLCVLLFVLLLAVSGFVLVYKNAKTRQRLAAVEKERLDAAIEMEKMEKELLRLKMTESDNRLSKAHKENLAMSLKIAEHTAEPDRLDHLERTLKDMDNDFIKKVERLYPTLSRNDVRLMSLIKTGMSSNEIASVLNITVESLHKSRYRLRKKLGLQAGQDLETFIDSLV